MQTDLTPDDPEIVPPFDYNAHSPEAAKFAREAVGYITTRARSATQQIIEIGAKLNEVKDLLQHGQFERWVAAEFAWSVRSCQNYMAAARAFVDKSETVAYLPVSTVYQLARVAEPIRDEVVKRIEAEQLPVDEVDNLIFQEKRKRDAEHAAAREAAQAVRKSPEQRARQKAYREKQDREEKARQQRWETERQARQAAAQQFVDIIVSMTSIPEQSELSRLAKQAGMDELAELLMPLGKGRDADAD